MAIDPSLFWDDQILVQRARALEDPSERPRAVYLSLSGHPPGGRMDVSVRGFADALAARASPPAAVDGAPV